MIDHDNGVYICDYCGGDAGEFSTASGNHSQCEDKATLEARKRNYNRALSLLREARPMGCMVVEYVTLNGVTKTMRDWITELLAEIDGKAST